MTRGPASFASVWPQMPFMRGPRSADRLHVLVGTLRSSRNVAQVRRERVLHYEWARKRLCSIFGYKKAEQWNGFVPPRLDGEGRLNTSEFRRALIDLLREVDEHDQKLQVEGEGA